MTPEEFTALVKKRDTVRKTRNTYTQKLRVLDDEIIKHCDHRDAKEVYTYFGGSYYDRASTTYYLSCPTCGLYEKVREKTHSYYG